MILLASERCGGMAAMTGVLGWKDAGSLGRTGWEHKESVSPSYVSDQLGCMVLHLGMDEEIFCIRIRVRAEMGIIKVGVCYRPPESERLSGRGTL